MNDLCPIGTRIDHSKDSREEKTMDEKEVKKIEAEEKAARKPLQEEALEQVAGGAQWPWFAPQNVEQ